MDWNFEADYFTACNCDWGCPCNFNARPTEGRCMGWGAWQIISGRYGDTNLDGTRFALYYMFPGPIEEGNGTACAYVDSRCNADQQEALRQIGTGKAGGGIFELFGADLVTDWLETKVVPIEFSVTDGKGAVQIGGIGSAESELLSYPDGTTIEPWLDLPHGIEYKRGLMTNAKSWSWSDAPLLANYKDRYGAASRVRFTQDGCVG